MMNLIKRNIRAILAISFVLVLVAQLMDTLYSDLTEQTKWVVGVIRLLPLVLFTGILRSKNPRLLIWFCFLLIGYFVGASLGAFSPTSNGWDITAFTAIIILFLAAMMHARWLAIAQQQPDNKDME